MSIIYPKNLTNVEKLSAFFGQDYGQQFKNIIAREPRFTYMAYVSQFGTDAPTAQVLFSNLEVDPVFTYDGPGTYKMLQPLINLDKTIVTISPGQVVAPETNRALAYVRGIGEISIATVDSTGTGYDDTLLNTMLKLEIW